MLSRSPPAGNGPSAGHAIPAAPRVTVSLSKRAGACRPGQGIRSSMKQRWLPVGVVVGVLFATNVIARWAVRLFAEHSDKNTTRIGLVALILVAVVMGGAAYWWARQHPMPRVVADLAVAAVAGCLLSV